MKTENYKRLLVATANDLRQRSVGKDDIAIERNAEVLDEIQRTSEREIALASLTRNWQTAMQVQQALERIVAGTYGTCLQCDEPISERRLAAIPWAKHCIRCQERADQEASTRELTEAA
jgi:DnaK suppressor protein